MVSDAILEGLLGDAASETARRFGTTVVHLAIGAAAGAAHPVGRRLAGRPRPAGATGRLGAARPSATQSSCLPCVFRRDPASLHRNAHLRASVRTAAARAQHHVISSISFKTPRTRVRPIQCPPTHT